MYGGLVYTVVVITSTAWDGWEAFFWFLVIGLGSAMFHRNKGNANHYRVPLRRYVLTFSYCRADHLRETEEKSVFND